MNFFHMLVPSGVWNIFLVLVLKLGDVSKNQSVYYHPFFKLIYVTLLFNLFTLHTLRAQQCTLPSRIYVPTSDEVRFEQVGEIIDVDGEYMVVGVPGNSSYQVYSGSASVYKLNNTNKWEKIAELSPSDPGKYRQFGSNVSISGNTIIIYAREYNDEGIARSKLYVFEKLQGGEWTSTNEDYVIETEFGTPLQQNNFGKFDLLNDELIAIVSNNGVISIDVYTKESGVFLVSQTIPIPLNQAGSAGYDWKLVAGPDYFVISNEQYTNQDGSSGIVYVYEKDVVYQTTPFTLRPVGQTASEWKGFGISIAVHNSTLFVQGLKTVNYSYDQEFYVFEKPITGWENMTQSAILGASGYVFTDPQLVANDHYFFATGAGYTSVVGFKKPAGGWSSGAIRFDINDIPAATSLVGYQLQLSDQHLIIGCAGRFLFTGIGEEQIVDYYSPTAEWDANDLTYQQIIREKRSNATDDYFGEAFSVYNDQLAITASGDDYDGVDAGVVYVFDTQNKSEEPDQKIYNPEEENYTGFGESIAMGDSVMFIGAPYKDSVRADGVVQYYNIGKVYIYRQTENGWVYSSQIKAPLIKGEVSFGRRVVWSPGYCAVTEFYGRDSESIGRVHIYKENTVSGKFEYLATLDPSTHLRSDFFGNSMIMTDSIMVIGTGNYSPTVSYRTSVYVFRKKGEWKDATQDATIGATDSGWSDRFGASIAMYDDYIVVGAPTSPGFESRPIPRSYLITGAAYIYKMPQDGWSGDLTEMAKLSPSDPTDFGYFGTSVAIDHNDIFIGSPSVYEQYNYTDKLTNNDNTLLPGKVYHFTKLASSEWESTNEEKRQLTSFEPEIVDGYGAQMFVSDRYLYVGAMFDDTRSGFRTGSVQTMMQLPVINAPSILCSNQGTVQLQGFPKNGEWEGEGVDPTKGIFNPALAGPGVHIISYTHSGCRVTTPIEVLVDQIAILSKSELLQNKCIGETIPLIYQTNEDAKNYRWYFKENIDDPYTIVDSLKQTISVNRQGYYEVRITREVCDTHSYVFQIIDEEKVPIAIVPIPPICSTDEITMEAAPPLGHWQGSGISPSGTFIPQNGIHKFYYESVTALGCKSIDSVNVIVDILRAPAIDFNDEPICKGKYVLLTLSNMDNRSSVVWSDLSGNEIAGQTGSTILIDEPGSYFATVSKGLCTLNSEVIELQSLTDSVFVPNVITPNNDALNDHLEIKSIGIKDFQLHLLNRYGKVFFETNDPNFKWSANDVSSGVYYWKISYKTCSNTRKEKIGWLQVLK